MAKRKRKKTTRRKTAKKRRPARKANGQFKRGR